MKLHKLMAQRKHSRDAIAATIAKRIGELRAVRGLSLHELAERAGCTKSHIWEIEQGRSTNPTIGLTVAIATALGVSLDYLTGLSNARPDLHPEALRIACEVDFLLRRKGVALESASPTIPAQEEG